jgi:VIT1/CCC1 family predicted Fe2+/Mn2+ transporter
MLELHAKFEHGIDPEQLGSPLHSAIASYFSFALGGAVPLLPWYVVGENWRLALYVSCALSAFALLFYDAALLRLVALAIAAPAAPAARAGAAARARAAALGGARQLAVGALAAGTTYGIGVLIGHRRM